MEVFRTASLIASIVLASVVAFSAFAQLGLYATATLSLRRSRSAHRHRIWRRLLGSPLAPRISVLVPAYNEEVSIAEATSAVLALNYPNLEVVVVNDGSSDGTVDRLAERFDLVSIHPIYQRRLETAAVSAMYRAPSEPRLIVVDKENGGKADATNCGLEVASGELVCVIDADTLVEPDCLQEMVMPFLSDPRTVAVGGTVRLVNDVDVRSGVVVRTRAPRGLLAGAQVVEYLRAFVVGRLAWNLLGGALIISGAFGLFRREELLAAGGYLHGSSGEDMELVVRLRRHGYEAGRPARIVYVPDPVAWTEAPVSLTHLAYQRNRWFRGLLEVLTRHRRMIANPRYGSAGLLALPYFVVVEALAPLVELAGLAIVAGGLGVGALTPHDLRGVAAAYLIGVLGTTLVLIVDELGFRSFPGVGSRLRLVGFVLFESLVYRVLTTIWRLWGLLHYLQGRSEWGPQVRRGFAGGTAEALG